MWWIGMPRKRQERATSEFRYKVKMFKWIGVQPTQQLVDNLTDEMWTERQAQTVVYKRVWNITKEVLAREEVDSALYVPYRAAAFEFYNKVLSKGKMKPEDWLDRWYRAGLELGLLREIADKLEREIGVKPVA